MKLRTCTVCGRPHAVKGARCAACRSVGRHDPTTRAQDGEYRAERARVLAPGLDGPPRCALRIKCDGAVATTVDHIVPVARGGRHQGNLQPACSKCNSAKGARQSTSPAS